MKDMTGVETGEQPGWDVAVCGLNCAACGLLASGDCAGCRGPLDRHWSADCAFLACARAKGLRYCFECEACPCDKLEAFAADGHAHHRQTVANLKEIKAVGLKAWLARQRAPRFCPGCSS